MLKVVWRNGRAYVRGTVRGCHCYEAVGTADPKLAEAYRAKREAELFEASVFGYRAVVSFQRAALSYLQHEPRSDATKFYVERLVNHFGQTRLAAIDQAAADDAVAAIVGVEAQPATKRRGVFAPLAAILNHGAKRKWCDHPKFDQPALPRPATPWLTPAQALKLESAAAPHLRPLIRFLLCTGARLAEAIDLDWPDLRLDEAKAIFRDTKNGRDRVAALPPAAVTVLTKMHDDKAKRTGRVFRRPDGEPYTDRQRLAGGQVKTAFNTAVRRAGLEDVSPHDLRHTWATWFYCVSKDLLLLQAEGGWVSTSMVTRYTHLMPADLAPEISTVWGASHPRLGTLPTRAPSVQPVQAAG